MTLEDRLREMAEAVPPEGSVTLPVWWLKQELGLAPEGAREGEGEAPLGDLTLGEVAEAVKRTVSTVRGWCNSGKLRAYKLNNRAWRIPREALKEFLASQREPKGKTRTNPGRGGADLGAWRRVAPNPGTGPRGNDSGGKGR